MIRKIKINSKHKIETRMMSECNDNTKTRAQMHPESLQLLRDVDAAQTRLKSTIKEAQKWLSASDVSTDPVRAVASFLRVLDQVAVLYSINYFRLGGRLILYQPSQTRRPFYQDKV